MVEILLSFLGASFALAAKASLHYAWKLTIRSPKFWYWMIKLGPKNVAWIPRKPQQVFDAVQIAARRVKDEKDRRGF